MDARYIVALIISITAIGLLCKAPRYLFVHNNMEQYVGMELITMLHDDEAEFYHQQTLTSGGVFSSYHFMHPACDNSFSVTPLFHSAEAVQLLQGKENITFYYRRYKGESFPSWHYLWREGIASLVHTYNNKTKRFPTVLAVEDESDCMNNISVEALWQ